MITEKSILGKSQKGVPSKSKIAPLWKGICENGDVDLRFVVFYNRLSIDATLRTEFKQISEAGGNSETSNSKIDNIIEFIKNYE